MANVLLEQLKSTRLGSDTRKLIDHRFGELVHECIPRLANPGGNTLNDEMSLFTEIVIDLIGMSENKSAFSENPLVSIGWNELTEKFVCSVISEYLGQNHVLQFFRAPNFQESRNDAEAACVPDYFEIQNSRQVL
eukprot:749019-Hanusia_phi.AAC.3